MKIQGCGCGGNRKWKVRNGHCEKTQTTCHFVFADAETIEITISPEASETSSQHLLTKRHIFYNCCLQD
jgi:hypothetical protein